MKYSITHICQIVEGEFGQLRRDEAIEHLLLDSRRLIFPATTLFFALKGPRRDGRLFLEELYQQGVRNFILQKEGGGSVASEKPQAASRGISGFPEANIIFVKDSLAALQQLAAWHRSRYELPVIGITGSNGKTIVKEWLNQLLEDHYQIVRSPKSYNSQTGVPLSVWQLNASHELAIFEAGISRRGEMQKLEKVLQPTIGLFTNIGEAHSEGFDSLAEKAVEKARLFDHAHAIVYCKDYPEIDAALGEAASRELFSWGKDPRSTLVILSVVKKKGATTILTRYAGEELAFTIPFTDAASIENCLQCICLLLYLREPADLIRSKLPLLSPLAMRLELKSGINHCSVINDSYSADLSSLQIALDFLSQQQQHTRRTVILSDILESGRPEQELYKEIAGALRERKIDRLVGIGARIGAHEELFRESFPGESVFFPSVSGFKKGLAALHFRDETILLKGARIFEFEQIDRLLSEQIHQTVLEINLNAMAANLRQYRQHLQPGTRLMAMVKAFAYGSGSYEIANLLQFHRVDYLGVAYADEGVVLRKAGIRMPIMVMNTEDNVFDALVQYNLEPVLYSFHLLESFDRWLRNEGIAQFPVHIELETGLHRLGFPQERTDELCAALKNSCFKVQSAFSHFAASEDPQQDAFTLAQAAIFTSIAGKLQEAIGYPFLHHIANSAAIIRQPGLQLDMVRLGIGLYGIDSAASHLLKLQEVSTLKSTIAQIKHLSEGDTVGYNRKGIGTQGMVIATVRIGYADGYPRSLGNGAGKMSVKGRMAPVIGIISMDMTMIDITGIPDIQEGDEVIVFGNELSVRQLAQWAQTIPYEILTGVSQRVKRVYYED